ncbi:hypothetical protein QWZ06_22315 [Chryseobacterium tructae]|uniref:Uncharacterized protein n=1 Tax=Chryseobacterium tructae TaxID=1037380 RepID=A0ABV7Y1V5_9FLAO|nr:hypothetical protein [Chryseobacterium tructae]MDN3694794.1 hypothetical protein [Chryseobacterium tructae]
MKYILLSAFAWVLFSCKGKENGKPVEKKDSLTAVKAAPNTESQKDFDILKVLLDEEVGNEKPEEIDYKNYTVSFRNDEDPYTVTFHKIASDDFNNDGITDYIIERNSEGMLGGNANTNSEILYIIMGKDHTISQRHEIQESAPFSYNVLDGISYEGGKLKATAQQNYRSYDKPIDSLESTELSFIYKDGNVFEESYLTSCSLAKWKDKKIFNPSAEQHRSIDRHNYTETIEEKYRSNGFEASAELSGCDNLVIIFEGTYETADTSLKSIGEKSKQFLSFLAKNTNEYLQKDLSVIQNYYLTHKISEDEVKAGNLSFYIFTNKNKGELNFRLVMTKESNPKQNENWEIVTRAK